MALAALPRMLLLPHAEEVLQCLGRAAQVCRGRQRLMSPYSERLPIKLLAGRWC